MSKPVLSVFSEDVVLSVTVRCFMNILSICAR